MDIPVIFAIFLGMIIAVYWDVKTRKIPNLLTFPMILFGILYHGISNGLDGIMFSAVGSLSGIGIFVIPYMLGGMGAGDAKLMGAVGAILGIKGVIVATVISVFVGFVYAIVLLLINLEYARSLCQRLIIVIKTFFLTFQYIPITDNKKEKKPTLSYALPIAMGTLCYVIMKITDSNLIQSIVGFKYII